MAQIQLRQTNSTSYIDVLGLQLGLDRLQGESTIDYLKRIEAAARLRRDHPYEGATNEINLQLGFEPSIYIELPNLGSSIINITMAGIQIDNNPVIPLVTFDRDSLWNWRTLSDVTIDINNITQATLMANDGPSFQLAKQSNSLWSFAEDIKGIEVNLLHSGVIVGSELFNQVVPSYVITEDGFITFSSELPAGVQITYNYLVSPYDIVGSPVSLIGLKDPEFVNIAEASTGVLAYQIREFVQQIMREDRSYWTK